MFIETALKNIALNTIMNETKSSSIYDMFDKVVSSYKNSPNDTNEEKKKAFQNKKLNRLIYNRVVDKWLIYA